MAGGKIEARVVVIMVSTIFMVLGIECLMSAVVCSLRAEVGCSSSVGAAE